MAQEVKTAKIYSLPSRLEKMDEQIRTGGEDSYALQAECSNTLYGRQMAAELVRRYNCHTDLVESVKLALEFLDSLNPGWLAKTTGDVGLLNDFYLKAKPALKASEAA